MAVKRVDLIQASGLVSSYKKKYKPKKRWDVEVFKDGANIAPDMFQALKKLDENVNFNKGKLYIIDLFRSWEVQAKARRLYKSGKKKSFVAKPGASFHNAGRAVDVSVKELEFQGIDKELWLQMFWGLAIPLGFKPIISIPDLGVSECWHFDFPGKDWEDSYDKLPYGESAKCAILDVGCWNPKELKDKTRNMFIQAQLIRLGFYEMGKIDGILGPKTNRILEFIGLDNLDLDTLSVVLSKRGP